MSNPTPLICAAKVRQFTLAQAAALRPHHPFNRVSADLLSAAEANLRAFIIARVRAHPSKGKTLT